MSNSQKNTEINAKALEADLSRKVDAEVHFDTAYRALYTTDGSNYRQAPIGVVIPRTKEAVIETVALCRKYEAPILSRGGGTSLAGQSCNIAVMIDFSKYLHRILDIDPQTKTAHVEPGCILDDLRRMAQDKYTLTFGPDPATHTHCTLGGMIGNNSCGIHSVMAGRTADNVKELEILTYDGLNTWVGATSDTELDTIIAQGGRKGQIYKSLLELRDQHAEEIRRRYPDIPRRVSGYNLDNLLPENGFHVARSLVGSEGTCVVILEAKLCLVHSPPQRTLLVLGYPDVYTAGDHIQEIMNFKPLGLEGIDDLLIDYMKRKNLHPEDAELLPEGKGWLLVELGADTKEESDAKAREVMEALKKEPNPPSMKLFTDPKEEHMIWEIRESGLGATANVPGIPLMWPGWEDSAVPPEKVGNYLRDLRDLFTKHKYKASLYGHLGQGCIHCRVPFDVFTHQGLQNYMSFMEEATDLIVSYGGVISGEHGDGQSRAYFLPKLYGERLVRAFKQFKTIWDPEGKMNPKKVVDPYSPIENLRLGTNYNPWQPETHFKFPSDYGSFPHAILRCVGVGKCRRTHNAYMCPSFLVTLDEMHTTRGRARALFEMFNNGVIKNQWRSKEVREALDLCLSCKACRYDCPVNVDMAMYKSEFLSHYYHHRLGPRSLYSMGLIGFWAKLGGKVPWLANFLTQTRGVGALMKFLGGITQKRPFPAFASESFSTWFKKRKPQHRSGKPVVIYPDVFNDYFYPNTLKAAVLVLEHWGYHVNLPPKHVSSIRPLIHYGMLTRTKKHLHKEVDQLKDFVRNGIPIIFMEPSTCAVFRDELPALFPIYPDGDRMTKLSYLLSEFIEKENIDLPKIRGKVIFHGHCHQKAVLHIEAARNILTKMGLEMQEPQESCCGMAGSFGFEADHYDISMKIGELYLLPAVRESDEKTFIVADGFSCRTQIIDGTGREPMHMSELLLTALQMTGAMR